MSFVGKILVVVQLMLSICFMAFAGAVYTVRDNWRTTAMTRKAEVDKLNLRVADLQTEFDKYKTDTTAAIAKTQATAGELEATNKGLKEQTDQLGKEKKELTVALASANQLNQIAGEESTARRREALELREINNKLLASRDELFRRQTELEDSLHGVQLNFDAAKVKVKTLLTQMGALQRTLEANNISSDPKDLAANVSVPPRVEGKILTTKTPKAKGADELVEISLGSDDGLTKGHELFVYRSGLDRGEKPRYLGKIRIVNTAPDQAVGVVVDRTRNGHIQEGDNVTSKL